MDNIHPDKEDRITRTKRHFEMLRSDVNEMLDVWLACGIGGRHGVQNSDMTDLHALMKSIEAEENDTA